MKYRAWAWIVLAASIALLPLLQSGSTSQAVARSTAPGDLDPTFGNGGKVVTDLGNSSDRITDVVVLPDGKILAAGQGGPTSKTQFAIARYNTNGRLDSSFGDGGYVFTDIPSDENDRINALAIQSDGKIVAAGVTGLDYAGLASSAVSANHQPSNLLLTGRPKTARAFATRADIAVVRYNRDGSLDESFGEGGLSVLSANCACDDIAYDVAIQPDGKIVLALETGAVEGPGLSGQFGVARLLPDGSLDPSFAGVGVIVSRFGWPSHASGIALRPNGKIIAAGTAKVNSQDVFALAQYNQDGSPDAGFGNDGEVTTSFELRHAKGNGLALMSDGRSVLAGWAAKRRPDVCQDCSEYDFAVVRYKTDGSVDTTFGDGGGVITPFAGSPYDYAEAVEVMANGKILVAGYADDDFGLVQYNADGSPDESFGDDGQVLTRVGSGRDQAFGLAVQGDNKIIVAGASETGDYSLEYDAALVRYLNDAGPPQQITPGSRATPTPTVRPRVTVTPPPATNSRFFPETGKTVKGRFLQYWQANGGLPQQGYPISEEMQERSETDGKTYTVQYFERAVFEYHPEQTDPRFQVLLSLLGTFTYDEKYPRGASGQRPNTSAGSLLFSQTGKRLGGRFLEYWRLNGGLAQQGYPISDEFTERNDLDGKTYTVQYFERAVFEYHPEQRDPKYQVLLSQLGTFRYREKYEQP